MECRLAESHVQEDRVESRVQHAVQEIGACAGWTNLVVCTGNRIHSRHAGKRAADVAKLVQTMRANVVGFEQEQMTQLALDSEVPALRVRRRKLLLENVITGERENDG